MRKSSIWNQREKANARFLTAAGITPVKAKRDQTNKEQLYDIWRMLHVQPAGIWRGSGAQRQRRGITPGPELVVDWDYRWNKGLWNKPVVLNLGNPLNVGGTHWVAVWRDKYFDSYGLPPSDILIAKGWKGSWNQYQIQGLTNGRCGQYCLIWLKHMLEDNERDFYKLFNIAHC